MSNYVTFVSVLCFGRLFIFFRCASGGKFFELKENVDKVGSCCHFEDGRYARTGVIRFCFVLLFFLSQFRNCF